MYNNNIYVFAGGNTRSMHSHANVLIVILNCDEMTAWYLPMCFM